MTWFFIEFDLSFETILALELASWEEACKIDIKHREVFHDHAIEICLIKSLQSSAIEIDNSVQSELKY